MGGTKPWPQATLTNKEATKPSVLIIGAGISGMCVAIDLITRKNCRDFVIVEKSSSVGGTWADNKYPGCCCDVWSVLYSYSFEQNPDWTREYPGQEEILQYLIKVASKYNLFPHIRFNTTVDEAVWDDADKKWNTTVSVSGSKAAEFCSEYTITSEFLISGIGQLNVPQYPDIKGLDSFEGRSMHSARWDWTYDFAGKKIAIIGNGATAAQILPEVAKTAASVSIHQRTPNWVFPRMDAAVTPLRQAVFKYLPPIKWRARAALMDVREQFHDAVTDESSPAAEMIRQFHAQALQAQLPDRPDLWETLTPKYSPGCKRVMISDDFFPALGRPNVTLETRRIAEITPTGIVYEGDNTAQGYDFLVLATGFRTVEFMHPIKITGRNGRSLASVWHEGAQAYRGVTIPHMPNFGILYGPNTNLGHNSIILMIEAQSRYLTELIGAVLDSKRQHKKVALMPRVSVTEAYNNELQAKLNASSFADPNCTSWYKNAAGRITNNWSGTVVQYQKDLSRVVWGDYEIVGDAEVVEARGESTYLGRVVEETQVSNATLLASVAGFVAVTAGVLLRNSRVVQGLLSSRVR